MKKKPKPISKKPKLSPKPSPKPGNSFMASDSQVEAGEQGYDNGGAFGIGMIKTREN